MTSRSSFALGSRHHIPIVASLSGRWRLILRAASTIDSLRALRIVIGCGLLLCASVVAAQGAPIFQASDDVPPADSRVAATVDGSPVFVFEVNQVVKVALGQREATPGMLRRLQAESLQQLVRQRVILSHLEQRGDACSDTEVEREVRRLAEKLERQEKTLEIYFQVSGHNQQSLRQQLRWELSWTRFLKKYMTDENLQRYYRDHRRDFDGTKLKIAQILLKVSDSGQRDATIQRAAKLREQIIAGVLSFGEAARNHSQSPTASDEGALGWISRHEPMPETFSRAAFQLDAGDMSPPVSSRYGVHLIQCLEVQPGTREWQESREQLTPAVARYLFDWMAARTVAEAHVQYTGAIPHFQPGTDRLRPSENSTGDDE